MKSLDDLQVAGRTVLVRADFNVPLADGPDGSRVITDDGRIRAALPTLSFLREQGARIVIACHLGRAKGEVVPELSLAPVAARLGELLGTDVTLVPLADAAPVVAAEQPGAYDVVNGMEMLEHVPDPSAVVRACAQLARPGGWVFFSTLNRNPKSFLFAIVGAEYVLRLLPRGTHEYAKFIRPSELARWAREAGLATQASRGMEYNPLTRRYWMSGDTSVNYLMACRKPG